MARFAVSTLQDQGAAVWIVAFLLLSYTTLTSLVRGYLKFRMPGLDDGVAAIAQLFTYGNVFSVIYGLRHGLAKNRSSAAQRDEAIAYAAVSQLQQGHWGSKAKQAPNRTRHSKQARYFTS